VLERIAGAADRPRHTDAVEQFKKGLELVADRLCDRALPQFLAAAELDDTDIATERWLGWLYLEGRAEDGE
jgi:hypothetical protein